jgi:hypothetical protein
MKNIKDLQERTRVSETKETPTGEQDMKLITLITRLLGMEEVGWWSRSECRAELYTEGRRLEAPSPKYTAKKVGVSRRLLAAVAALATIVVLAGCSSSNNGASAPTTTTSVPSGSITPTSTSSLPPYNPVIHPAAFTNKVTNTLFPLTPGMTYIYQGTRDGVPRHTELTITKETKTIMGVSCVVVRDVVTSNNALVEKTTDWYAQDSSGNVWYFGEDTAEYVNGAVTSTAGTWLAGVDGALPGIVMEASPKVGDAYRQEYRPGVAEDFAKIIQIDASTMVPAGSYTHTVVTQDTDLLDATKLEHKWYAPGVGYIGGNGTVNGHMEDIKLISILKS